MDHKLKLLPLKEDDKYCAMCTCHQWIKNNVTARKAMKAYDTHVRKAK